MTTAGEPLTIILEDDLKLRASLVRGLGEEGFRARGVGTGAELLDALATTHPDLIVIDIGLPDADGRDVCLALRARGIVAPVLFLTALGRLPDLLTGFNSGGDDYLTKPFAFEELLARLHALLRRSGGPPAPALGRFTLDPGAHAVVGDGVSVRLSPTEFRLLARLAATPGAVVRRSALIATGWPDGAIVADNTLDAFIARIRGKLATLPDGPRITATYGVGYSIA
jgi:two-component system response regulator MprA